MHVADMYKVEISAFIVGLDIQLSLSCKIHGYDGYFLVTTLLKSLSWGGSWLKNVYQATYHWPLAHMGRLGLLEMWCCCRIVLDN